MRREWTFKASGRSARVTAFATCAWIDLFGRRWRWFVLQRPPTDGDLAFLKTLARDWAAHGVSWPARDGEPLLTASGLPKRGVRRPGLAHVRDAKIRGVCGKSTNGDSELIELFGRMERERAAVRCL